MRVQGTWFTKCFTVLAEAGVYTFGVCWCHSNTSDRTDICRTRGGKFLAVFRLIGPVQSITECIGPFWDAFYDALLYECLHWSSLCVFQDISSCMCAPACWSLAVLNAGAGLSQPADTWLITALVFLQAQLNSRGCALPSLLAHWEQSSALHLLLFQRAHPSAGAAPAHCDPRHSKPTCQCHHHSQWHWWGRGQQIQTCQVGSSFRWPVLICPELSPSIKESGEHYMQSPG